MRPHWRRATIALALGTLIAAVGSSGCIVRARAGVTATVVDEDPPPPRRVVVRERAGHVWVQGRWEMRGGRWVWDEAALEATVRPESRLLFLCNPQNPGGTIFKREELDWIAKFAQKHDLVICSDEIHADILLDEGKPHVPIASLSPDASKRSVTLISPNKAFGFPGAGCAFAIIEDAESAREFSFGRHSPLEAFGETLFGSGNGAGGSPPLMRELTSLIA